MGHNRVITATYFTVGLLVLGGIASAQEPDQQPHAWRVAPDAPAAEPQFQADQGAPPPPPNFSANQQGNYPQGGPPQQMQQPQQAPMRQPMQQQQQNYAVPPQLTLRPGTFVSVRMNQGLSSDHNQQGDTFFATLAQPLIVDGVVVAQRGQTVMGRVTESQKAGRVEGTSRLGLELTGLTLVDGQQLPLQSQMVNRSGGTSVGRDVGAVAGTTALGAAIGAGADWGRGAAIGAGAGAAAGIIGVLLTRGRPTVVYPESVLTFRVTAPATVVTERAPQAFRYVDNQDYNRSAYSNAPPQRREVLVAPQPYGYAPYPYYGYGYGPAFSLYFGPSRYGYRGGFYYRGRR